MNFVAILVLLLPLMTRAQESVSELKEFRTDGCSWSPDGTLFNPNKYTDCCKLHDFEYWIGGTSEQREEADLQFRQCLVEAGASGFTAGVYYRAVRQFGRPKGCAFCWGYGWEPQATDYAPLTEAQLAQVPDFTKEDILNTPVKLRRRGE